ncbi:hypothetical protein L484_008284 [Morus notabilis]|uniref:Retrotransposon gag domain-containing protein n=1 Tax=Morus notabilis TaxID=981085 RepID=W9RRL6_9ROSA|nr:hypothetical protein L484_008284 [Morus notabilis]
MVARRAEKNMDGRLEFLEKDIRELKLDDGELRSDIGELKGVVGQLSEDIGAMREYMKELTGWMRSGGMANPPAEQARASTSSGEEGGSATMAVNNSGNGPTPNGWDTWFYRMEIPLFNGEDPHGWLFQLERYFHIQYVDEAERVVASVIRLEGKVLNWFRWLESRSGSISWPFFKESVMQRLCSSQTGNHYEALIALQQDSTVAEFREKFELLLAPFREADKEFLIGAFSNGLAKEVKAEVHMVRPTSLVQLMDLTQKIEEKNWALERPQVLRTTRSKTSGDWVGNFRQGTSFG